MARVLGQSGTAWKLKGRSRRGGLLSRYQHDLGERGEEVAVLWLKRRGFAIEWRRFRGAGGEVDIVAVDEEGLVFVEVKTRASRGVGHGAEAVTVAKQRAICQAAAVYLMRHGQERPARFAVLQVDERHGRYDVTWMDHAFEANPW